MTTRIIASALVVFLSLTSLQAQTAAPFKTKDCSGKMHDLFAELDSGFVVVIDWVMPCGSCSNPTKIANMLVQRSLQTNPEKIRFYVADDYSNTSCTDLQTYLNGLGVSGVTTFSDTAVKMGPYGQAGMPKIVVLAGYQHQVLYNKNNGIDSIAFKTALSTALVTASTKTYPKTKELGIVPNPAKENIRVTFYSQNLSGFVSIKNVSGQVVVQVPYTGPGEFFADISIAGLRTGMYFLRAENSSGILVIDK
jgi:hypothetical protein